MHNCKSKTRLPFGKRVLQMIIYSDENIRKRRGRRNRVGAQKAIRLFDGAANVLHRVELKPNLLERERKVRVLGKTIGEELLTPTRLYPKTCLPLIEKFDIHGMVHITGGGFYDNIPRALPEDMAVEIDSSVWQMPTIFRLLQQWGNVDWHEMYRTFNMGICMVIMASREEADKIKAYLAAENETVYEIGRIVRGNHDVTIKGGVFDE